MCEKVRVALVADEVRESHPQWFGHIKHQSSDDLARKVDVLDLVS